MNPSEYQAARDAIATQSPKNVSTSPYEGEVAQLNARIDELKGDLKWTYEDGIIQRCKVNLLKERLVKWADTNPFHGQSNALHGCFKENGGDTPGRKRKRI